MINYTNQGIENSQIEAFTYTTYLFKQSVSKLLLIFRERWFQVHKNVSVLVQVEFFIFFKGLLNHVRENGFKQKIKQLV